MVFQDPYGSLDPHLTAVDIVAEPLRSERCSQQSERERRAAELHRPGRAAQHRAAPQTGRVLRRPAPTHRHRPCAGQSNPRLLVCDEATSALDVSVQAQVLDLLREIQARHRPDLCVHLPQPRRGAGDQRTVVVMASGSIVESGRTAEVLASPTQPYTRALRAAALDPTTMVGIKPRARGLAPESDLQLDAASQGAA